MSWSVLPLRILVFLCLWFGVSAGSAQELTPRAHWPLPAGTNVVVLAYQRTEGDVVASASLPVEGVESETDIMQFTYQRAFHMLGRNASVQFSVPFADGRTSGVVDGNFLKRSVNGIGDARLRLALNLKGVPEMDRDEFRAMLRDPGTIIGASVTVEAPTGEYESDRVVNIGTNRWAIRPAVGMILPIYPGWLFETEAAYWVFGDNDNYLGQRREQEPVFSLESHVVKRIRPGFWVSLDATFYHGGKTQVENGPKEYRQRNSRAGMTAVFPFKGGHALRASWSTSIETEFGGDFDKYSLSYLYAW